VIDTKSDSRQRFTWAVFLVLAAANAWGQQEASIGGTVADTSGSAVAGVDVTVKSVETGAIRKALTDGSGHYDIALLRVGNYEVTAEKGGFQTQNRTGIALVLGQRAVVNFSLPVGEVRETVQVTDQAPGVNITTSDVSGLVGERQVKDLPLNGRSFDNLLTLNTGIVNVTGERAGGVGTSASAVGNMFSVSGHRPEANLFLLNGIEYTGSSQINVTPGGASGQLLGVDAIREFELVKDNYGAEYGKRAGAQIAIVTTSGTNQLHGSLYEFLRNSDLDARNFFDRQSVPQFQRNVFGGSLGGPIRKNKTFIFGNYEGFRQRLGLSNVTLVPDNASRAAAVASVQPLLNLWPVQNGPELGGGIAIAYNSPKQAIREDFGTARVDHNFSDSDTLAGVYTIDDSIANTPSVNPLSLVDLTVRNQVASLSESHIFSPTIINKLTIGFSRAAFSFTGVTPVDIPGFIQGKPIGPVTIGGGTGLNASSSISPAGTNGNSNLRSVRNLFTLTDQVLITRGIHTFNVGFWLQQIQSNDNLAATQYGQAVFTNLQTFLRGTIATFTAIPNPTPLSFRSLEGAYYAEDVIKLRPTLELRIGFRGEFTNGWNETHDRSSNWLFDSRGIIETNPLVGQSPYTDNKAKFLPAPRIGLAWSPFSKNTVIRAGFGIYYTLNDSISYRLTQSAPFNTVLVQKNIPVSAAYIVPGAAPASGSKISPAGIQPDLATPATVDYSLTIQQAITPSTTLSVGYVGSHGYHELLSIDANTPLPTYCPAAPCPAGYPSGILYFAPNAPLANPALANTTHWFSWGSSYYNGLQVDVARRLGHGLQFRGTYTFSKSLDEGSSLANAISGTTNAFVMNPFNARQDYGLSSFDVRHAASINATYEIPFRGRSGSGAGAFASKLISNWQTSVIATVQSGLPFSPQLGFNPTNDGNSRNPGRPSINPAFTGNVIEGNPNQYFNPNAFLVPLNGTYGTAGRDILEGPGLVSVDLSLSKRIAIRERLNLQFRAEFFNVLNHTNFNSPNPIVFTAATGGPSSTAGLITSTTTTSRQIQFGLKLGW
jgi:Carboxypeptidase regulatory-like domain